MSACYSQHILKNQNLAFDERSLFIEDMGQHMVGWGLPRNTGRVWAYLLLQPEPVGLDRIAVEMGMAKSGASVATRQLVQLALARSIQERGSRRLLFTGLTSLESVFAARQAHLNDLVTRLRQGATVAPAGPPQRALEEMVQSLEGYLEVAPQLLQQIRERSLKP